MNLSNNKGKSSTSFFLLAIVSAVVLLIFSILIGVGFGTISIPINEVYSVLMYKIFGIGSYELWGTGSVHDVVWLIRLPRIILAVAVGMGLSVCGVVMQAIVKNPLADPFVLGVSSGAYLGATLSMVSGFSVWFGANSMGVFGCIGALIASFLVMSLANLGGKSNSIKLILAGTAISAICSAFSNFIIIMLNDSDTSAVVQWSMGGLGGADWESNPVILTVIVLGTVFFLTQSRVLNLMLLGDDSAVTLGTDVHRWRILYLIIASLMVGFSVYKAGMIGFVGLVIPHMVRMVFGTDHRKLLPLSALFGSIFLLWADILCRRVLPGNEIPVGILTSMVGAPVFIYLMVRKKYGFGGRD